MASKKEKLTGALSRIRTCDPPLRRRMLYPTELPGHRDIVPEPKECPIRVQSVPSRQQASKGTLTRTQGVSDQSPACPQPTTSQERDALPELTMCPININPFLSQQQASKGHRIKTHGSKSYRNEANHHNFGVILLKPASLA